ncbi:MAG: hypothetical protein A2452_05185 [Candidatus Firestonebacteria bacterium RIFOXYC2_FULL_39_67]|nr:MAG: hypothetical protein A2452_05185 [Candidatus Firestonebacteria bacterium RIFOXYC2_FULL_39_67]
MKAFISETKRIMALPIAYPVNTLGGYGKNGEVIYERSPKGCPSVLVDNRGAVTATFMSNGSAGFMVKLPSGMEIKVLESHFDISEKKEINAPSNNVWLRLDGKETRIASLMNPRNNINLSPKTRRLVKLGDPLRAYWYTASFAPEKEILLKTAIRLSFVETPKGPALMRQICIINHGKKRVSGQLLTHYTLHGTQRFAYNKDIWYDSGLAVSPSETVVSAFVPYSDAVQIKRLSSSMLKLKPIFSTCDYSAFAGDTSANIIFPDAVLQGKLLDEDSMKKLSRFATPTIAANAFEFDLKPEEGAVLFQSLMYITDKAEIRGFRKNSSAPLPTYASVFNSYKKASKALLAHTPDAKKCAEELGKKTEAKTTPYFDLDLPNDKIVSLYANSLWTGVKELYENCRAHGAKLADGIEIGTRDRAQDMWPKIKEDPCQVRADLIHAMSFMYMTVKNDPDKLKSPLSLRQKLHGMFPRQFPSRWNDRAKMVMNDNRPYTDSPVWMLNAVCMYIKETGDISILAERVKTITLTTPDTPERSGIVGGEKSFLIAEVIIQVLFCFERHVKDSPYGLCQILYGDWCDPIDMFGTSKIGDEATRGKGRGAQVRLSAHLFSTLIEIIDMFETQKAVSLLKTNKVQVDLSHFKYFAGRLRENIIKFGWEDGTGDFPAAFISAIHELKLNGKVPAYKKGETGYTLGSMKGRDYDGLNRRELTAQAFGLEMLGTKREYLTPLEGANDMIKKLLRTMDTLFYRDRLGLVLFTTPIGNNQRSLDYAGRMGILPVGTAENGEYHHAQLFMHYFRLGVEGEENTAWKQFKPIISALRDESLAGPFETTCTSYVSDPEDPHFGKAMYFGLSGTVDWIVEFFQRVAGVKLALHDSKQPDLKIEPRLPKELKNTLTFKRIIHCKKSWKDFVKIPLTIEISRKPSLKNKLIKINGKRVEKAEIPDVSKMKKIRIEIIYPV